MGAKRRDDGQLESLVKTGKLSNEVAASLKLNTTCNKLIYPPAGIQADQLPEAFADWFSAEVIARSEKVLVEKIRADLCEDKVLSEGSSYPSNSDRLNKIYFAQPKLKTVSMADGKSAKYCGFE